MPKKNSTIEWIETVIAFGPLTIANLAMGAFLIVVLYKLVIG